MLQSMIKMLKSKQNKLVLLAGRILSQIKYFLLALLRKSRANYSRRVR
jgi:hypothetical protein